MEFFLLPYLRGRKGVTFTAISGQCVFSFITVAMAGNIIPAIATTNAVISGLIVMEALKILGNEFNKCKTVKLLTAV